MVLSKCPPLPPKKPIPIHCDQITGKPKYVDPAHRNCVPGFKAASFTPKNKFDKYNGRTHNCIAAVTTYSGERYGYMHPHKMTGYKAENAYGKTPLFDGLTTNNYFDHKIRKVGEEMDHAHKKLCVYDPSANRNKPRAFSHNTVGLHTFDRRNASYIRLESGDKKDLKTPLSTHKRFHVLPRSMTGLSNPGIFSGIGSTSVPFESTASFYNLTKRNQTYSGKFMNPIWRVLWSLQFVFSVHFSSQQRVIHFMQKRRC